MTDLTQATGGTDLHSYVRAATLNGYVGLARGLGLDPGALLARVGLSAADLAQSDQWISAAAVSRLLDASAAESGCEDFALRLAQLRRLSTLGPLSVVLREEPDLRRVLELLMRYERSYNEALRMRLVENEDLTTVRMWMEFGEPAPVQQALVLGVAALHSIIRECVKGEWRPLSVCFTQSRPDDPETFHAMFGPSLRFEHEFNGLVLYSRDLDEPNLLSDPLMQPYAQQLLATMVSPRATTASARVRDSVEFLLPLGKCSVNTVARSLGVDRRTLQRHLAGEGESFSAIVHETRARLAERHLANDRYTMTEVSQQLGFEAPSAFSRWFQQQFGVSPTTWRSRAVVEAAP